MIRALHSQFTTARYTLAQTGRIIKSNITTMSFEEWSKQQRGDQASENNSNKAAHSTDKDSSRDSDTKQASEETADPEEIL
jgi:hypothetical protein